jgi:hypothetical protein
MDEKEMEGVTPEEAPVVEVPAEEEEETQEGGEVAAE